MSDVMTVAREVASRRHVIAKKPVTVKMMTVKKHPRLDTATGKLPSTKFAVMLLTRLPFYGCTGLCACLFRFHACV